MAVAAMQTVLLLDHIRNIIRDYTALRTDLDAASAADTAVGNQISVSLFFCVAEGERRSFNRLLAEVEPLAAALTELEYRQSLSALLGRVYLVHIWILCK